MTMLISDKFLKEPEAQIKKSFEEKSSLQDKIDKLYVTHSAVLANKETAFSSKELKFLAKFFRYMVVVPNQFGVAVELGRVNTNNSPSVKRFLEEKGFKIVASTVDKGICYCQYIGTEGHNVFIQFEE